METRKRTSPARRAGAEEQTPAATAELATEESKTTDEISSHVAVIAETPETPETTISDLEVAKKMIKISQSAADRKLEFNLTFETVKRLMGYKSCFYTNRPFGDEGGLWARSFDRIDSAKGYVEGNVVACTVDINQKKSNLSLEEIACLYNKLVKKS